VSVVLFAVSSVQIPLTAFAFLGGALAIGAGFGAQNLINNFISGVILLLERPIKLGDIVDIEGVRGRVMRVGLRCSIVRRFDGIDMLIPNSSFLEKNVTNWTLSDPYLRFTVTVGVAYGSPTEKVKALLEQAVREHEKIRKFPEPLVVFEEFGESSLDFTVFFWIAVSREADYRVVASDLRFRIDQLLREAGITIAFPQRDVHLDGMSPLQVEIVEGAREAAGGREEAAPGGGEPPRAVGRRGQEPGP
jgi:potassium efflux system protein